VGASGINTYMSAEQGKVTTIIQIQMWTVWDTACEFSHFEDGAVVMNERQQSG
jgi:hypothetical protein